MPVFFVLLITIGPSQDGFGSVNSMLEQVASYQFVGMLRLSVCSPWHIDCSCIRLTTHRTYGRHLEPLFIACSLFRWPQRALLQSWCRADIAGPFCRHSVCVLVPIRHLLLHLLSHGELLSFLNSFACDVSTESQCVRTLAHTVSRLSFSLQVAGMVSIFYSLRRRMNEEIMEHQQLLFSLNVRHQIAHFVFVADCNRRTCPTLLLRCAVHGVLGRIQQDSCS